MRTRWTKEEMENVLIQLNNESYPFKEYHFSKDDNGLVILGSGGYANVYEMEKIDNPHEKVAVKVIGFGEGHVDSETFRESVQMQMELSYFQNDVVKIIDYAELHVFMDMSCQVLNVNRVSKLSDKDAGGDCLHLQFVLMEKLMPVLTMDKAGKPKLYPKELADFKENEIMNLAYNIGTALARAHESKLLHRDIKLENVFYDPHKKVYKLGDFGVSKLTEDGMASTVAFTKGYGAPEVVGAVDERYDNTADIYSYGIMLYVLFNKLKFPDSENYNVNVTLQYSKGYQFPKPEINSEELSVILDKMCRYNPDERYQSMDKVLNDLEGVIIDDEVRLKKDNINSTYVAGMVCYVFGMILWKLTHMPELLLDIGVLEYVFLIMGGYEYWLNQRKKECYFLRFVILCLGIYLVIFTGFSWWKMLFVLGVSFSQRSFSGMAGMGVVITDVLARILHIYPQIYDSMQQYNWLAVFLLSFSLILFIQCCALSIVNKKIKGVYFKSNMYWKVVIVIYGVIMISGWLNRNISMVKPFDITFYDLWYGFLDKYDCFSLGLCGVGLSLGWRIREKVLCSVNDVDMFCKKK